MIVTLLIVALGLMGTWLGVQTWRGKEAWGVRRVRDRGEPFAPGGRLDYGTFMGACAGLVIGGPAFILMGVGDFLHQVLHKPDSWWLSSALIYTGLALLFLSLLYLFVYQWIGMPNALRPPAQRGQAMPCRRRRRYRTEARDDEWFGRWPDSSGN